MKTELRTLDQVHVAKQCPAIWDEMKGNDQVRHCSQCRLNVYNLSEMSADAALKFMQKAEGRTCIRFYRREDGTMITQDCPRGLRAFRQRAAKRLVLACSMVLSAVGCGTTAERLKADFGMAPTPAPAPTPKFLFAGEGWVLPPKSPGGLKRPELISVAIAKGKKK